jgi:hypothetical protein
MAASLMGIMALVWVNMSSSTSPRPSGPQSQNSKQAVANATPAPMRSNLTRSPVRSLMAPQA